MSLSAACFSCGSWGAIAFGSAHVVVVDELTGVSANFNGNVLALTAGTGSAGADVAGTYLHALSSPLVWLGLGLYGASAVLWLWVLSRLDVSLAYPLVSLGFVVTMGLGIVWLGEPFSTRVVAGCPLTEIVVSVLAR